MQKKKKPKKRRGEKIRDRVFDSVNLNISNTNYAQTSFGSRTVSTASTCFRVYLHIAISKDHP